MAVDVAQGKAYTFRLRPKDPMVSPAAVVLSRAGKTLETPTATPDPASTSVASASDESTFTVASAGALARGRLYRFAHTVFGVADREVAIVDGTTVRLLEPLPEVPPVGTTMVGLEVVVGITSASTSALALWNKVVVSAGDAEVVEVFNVVTHPYRGPVEARHVREYLSRVWQGEQPSEAWCGRIARTTNDRIRGRLLEAAEYVSAYWDPGALEEIGALQMRLVLAENGFGSKGRDPESYLQGLQFDLRDRMGGLMRGATPQDANADGSIDDDEAQGFRVVELRR